MKQKKTSAPTSRIIIKGEGRDEWGNRYFKLAVRGADDDLPPFSMKQISSASESLYNALSNAGLNIFTPKAKKAVLELLQVQQRTSSATNAKESGRSGLMPSCSASGCTTAIVLVDKRRTERICSLPFVGIQAGSDAETSDPTERWTLRAQGRNNVRQPV